MGEGIVFSGLGLLCALFLVALNGLFVTAEFAFTRLRATRVESMVREGKVSAGLVREATQNLDGYVLRVEETDGARVARLNVRSEG